MSKNSTSPSVDDKWRVESDVRTLVDAQTIRNDPKRFAAAKKLAKEQAEKMQAIGAQGAKK